MTSINNICRTCLTQNDKLISLINKSIVFDSKETQMSYVLEICTSIQIHNNDMPYLICSICEDKLCNAYNFRQQALKSEETLKNYTEINNCEEIKEEEEEETTRRSDDVYFDENEVYYLDATEPVGGVNEVLLGLKTSESEPEYDPSSTLDGHTDSDEAQQPVKAKRKRKKHKSRKNDARRTVKVIDPQVVTEALEEHTKKKQTKLECRLCGFISNSSRGLSLHISYMHKEMKNKWCSVCFIEVRDLNEHKKTHRHDKHFQCVFCSKSFGCQGHLVEHIRSHSGDRPYKCEECKRGFVSARHLRVHLRIHTGERPYSCDICNKSFAQKGSLISHEFTHKNEKCYKCEVCKRSFYKLKYLASHIIRTSHGEQIDPELLKSDIVSNKTDDTRVEDVTKIKDDIIYKNIEIDSNNTNAGSSPIYIATEVRDDQNDNGAPRSSLCNVCNKTFSSYHKLRLHMRLHTGDTPYACKFCTKKFNTRSQLVTHIRVHTKERPHVCHICGKGFGQSSVLNTHMKLHTGRPEQCKICDQRFCRPAELRLHMRKHTGEKPYLCTDCGQSFVQSSHLMEHIKRHSDERPYQCPHCSRGFKHKGSLRSHVQIHTGEKPFKCQYCPYACRQSYSLTQHMRQHVKNEEKPHVCTTCWKEFPTNKLLKAHNGDEHDCII